ncbi:4a-hydroxytetrahydrobiopterin dehydratase [Pelagibaculum spongiae]|nr:4a-hydroxytetrahydrobiopterin dehydratase [Pelagibaculum spongiae]
MKLSEMTCEACQADAPQLTDEQLAEGLAQLSDWRCETIDDVQQLHRSFSFDDFAYAFIFVAQVAEIAMEHDHHPRILLEYGKVEVHWWTHKIKGLHQNDLVMAAKTDQLLDANE